MSRIKIFWSKYKSYIFLTLIVLLALKVFVPEMNSLKESLQAVKDADLNWILFGQIVFFLGLPILTMQFLAIALKPLKFRLTYHVQMAGLFVSKLFPSSLGTFALNYYYLMQKKHTSIEAATVMTINALTSGLAYVFIFGFAIVFDDGSIIAPGTSPTIDWHSILRLLVAIVAVAVCSLFIKKVRRKIAMALHKLLETLGIYKNRKGDVVAATILNFAGSLTSLIALWASAHALGVDISMSQALVAYVFGNIMGGLVPTPGGIGAVEAGIYSGLVLVGVDSSDALTITLVYRFLTYWVPILPGYYYFWSLRKDVLKSFSLKRADVSSIGKTSS